MKHCNNCNIDVNSDSSFCPLCYNNLETKDAMESTPLYELCEKKPRSDVKTYFITRLFTLFSLIIIGGCLFINFIVKGKPWSLIVVSSILYLWVLIRHTIMSLRNTFEKVFLQLCGIALILISTSFMSTDKGWFLNYVLPSVLIGASVTLLMVLFCSPKRKLWVFSFFIMFIIMIIIGVVFWCTKFAGFKLLYSILVVLNALIVIGIMLMDFKTIKAEFTKKFHL